MTVPIWRDRFVTLGTAQYYDFQIRLGDAAGDVVYSGRAWLRPGAQAVTIRINDICADWLQQLLPDRRDAAFTPFPLARTFVTGTVADGAFAPVDTVTFLADWSYDRYFDPATMPLADPVRHVLDPRQWLFVSTDAGSVRFSLAFSDGRTQTVVVTGNGPGAAALDLSRYPGISAVTAGRTSWSVDGAVGVVQRRETVGGDYNSDFSDDFLIGTSGGGGGDDPGGSGGGACARYVVHYVNAYGGWDSLVVEGAVRERYALERHTAREEYDNADPAARGLRDYAVGVTPSWELSPGLLTDEQSEKMRNLLASALVYLCDLGTGEFIPVVLTDTSHEVQQFRTNGRAFSSYTFTAQLAQDRFRR